MRDKKTTVAVIDDGIVATDGLSVVSDLYVDRNGIIRERLDSEIVMTNHGTNCARIISHYAENVDFISVKIFDGEILRTNIDRLASALNWCIDKGIKVINLSLGSTKLSDYNRIRRIVYCALKKDIIIVSACSNSEGLYTMPACMCGIYGVKMDELLKGDAYYISCALRDEVTIFASSFHSFRQTKNISEIPLVNSFAAPTVTANVIRIIYQNSHDITNADLRKRLGMTGLCNSALPDFLVECILIDYRETEEDYELFDFTIKSKYSSVKEYIRSNNNDERSPIVLIPKDKNSLHKDEMYDILDACKERIGFVFAGVAEDVIATEIASRCLYWDEKMLFTRYADIGDTIIKAETPNIIVLKGSTFKTICFGQHLKKFLENKGIECQIFADYNHAVLYGLIYISCAGDIYELLKRYSNSHNVDVAIIILDEYEDTKFDNSITICLEDNLEFPNFDVKRDLFEMDYNSTQNDFERLYDEITE